MGNKLPQKRTAERYGRSIKTLDRWREDPKINFPKCMIINGQKYDDEDELENWERWRAANPEPRRITQPPKRLKTTTA
jgi:hypothetical protein